MRSATRGFDDSPVHGTPSTDTDRFLLIRLRCCDLRAGGTAVLRRIFRRR